MNVCGYQCTVPGSAVFNEHRGKGKWSFDIMHAAWEPWLEGFAHPTQYNEFELIARISSPHFCKKP